MIPMSPEISRRVARAFMGKPLSEFGASARLALVERIEEAQVEADLPADILHLIRESEAYQNGV